MTLFRLQYERAARMVREKQNPGVIQGYALQERLQTALAAVRSARGLAAQASDIPGLALALCGAETLLKAQASAVQRHLLAFEQAIQERCFGEKSAMEPMEPTEPKTGQGGAVEFPSGQIPANPRVTNSRGNKND